jgi:hypothetical protein
MMTSLSLQRYSAGAWLSGRKEGLGLDFPTETILFTEDSKHRRQTNLRFIFIIRGIEGLKAFPNWSGLRFGDKAKLHGQQYTKSMFFHTTTNGTNIMGMKRISSTSNTT